VRTGIPVVERPMPSLVDTPICAPITQALLPDGCGGDSKQDALQEGSDLFTSDLSTGAHSNLPMRRTSIAGSLAGYEFDVPVTVDTDRISGQCRKLQAGQVPDRAR